MTHRKPCDPASSAQAVLMTVAQLSRQLPDQEAMMDAFERRSQKQTQYRGRVSMEVGDPGFAPLAKLHKDGYHVHVYLDGVRQPLCEAADPETGWLKRMRVHADGEAVIVNNHFQSEELRGEVVIRLER
jgi:hypothetical protein